MKTQEQIETLHINGVEYIRKGCIQPTGNRAVIIVDRGWIFAGDVTEENDKIKLSRAIHIKRWESIGFDGMIANPNSNKVQIANISDIEIPKQSEIFRVPVKENWGLE